MYLSLSLIGLPYSMMFMISTLTWNYGRRWEALSDWYLPRHTVTLRRFNPIGAWHFAQDCYTQLLQLKQNGFGTGLHKQISAYFIHLKLLQPFEKKRSTFEVKYKSMSLSFLAHTKNTDVKTKIGNLLSSPEHMDEVILPEEVQKWQLVFTT